MLKKDFSDELCSLAIVLTGVSNHLDLLDFIEAPQHCLLDGIYTEVRQTVPKLKKLLNCLHEKVL